MNEIKSTTRLLVLGQHAVFREWMAEHDISPKNRNLVHLREGKQLMGLDRPLYLLLHGWEQQWHGTTILAELAARRAKEASEDDIRVWVVLNRRTQPA